MIAQVISVQELGYAASGRPTCVLFLRHLGSGLGYSRARHVQSAARVIVSTSALCGAGPACRPTVRWWADALRYFHRMLITVEATPKPTFTMQLQHTKTQDWGCREHRRHSIVIVYSLNDEFLQ